MAIEGTSTKRGTDTATAALGRPPSPLEPKPEARLSGTRTWTLSSCTPPDTCTTSLPRRRPPPPPEWCKLPRTGRIPFHQPWSRRERHARSRRRGHANFLDSI